MTNSEDIPVQKTVPPTQQARRVRPWTFASAWLLFIVIDAAGSAITLSIFGIVRHQEFKLLGLFAASLIYLVIKLTIVPQHLLSFVWLMLYWKSAIPPSRGTSTMMFLLSLLIVYAIGSLATVDTSAGLSHIIDNEIETWFTTKGPLYAPSALGGTLIACLVWHPLAQRLWKRINCRS